METRQVTEVKIYLLVLNPMRGNTENADMVAYSYDKQKLIDYYNSQLAPEPYNDEGSGSFECHGPSHTWYKVFNKGSKLEWYNPCDLNVPNHYEHGIIERWTKEELVNTGSPLFIN